MTSRTAQRAETKPNYKKLATQVQTGHTGPVKEHKLVNTWQAPVHTQITGFFVHQNTCQHMAGTCIHTDTGFIHHSGA